MISKLYLITFCYGRTDARTDGQAESNMPLQHFQSWGHNKTTGLILSWQELFLNSCSNDSSPLHI